LQASVAGQFNNMLGLAESIETQYVTDPDDDERAYVSTRFSMPINRYGTIFGADFAYSDTQPGFELAPFRVKGYSKTYGLDIRHPIIRSRTENIFTSLRFDYRDLTSKNIVDSLKTKDEIAALRWGLGYSAFDSIWRPAVNEVSLQLSQGLDVFNASSAGDANLTRINGDPTFTKINADISRLQTITAEWNVFASLTGQLSNNPLLSSEEFGVGGRAYGRGYDASEIVGDDGFGASIEVRWNPDDSDALFEDYEIYGFYDFGKIWNQSTDVDVLEDISIASVGIGTRIDFTSNVNGELIFAYPLTKEVSVYDSADSKLLFSLGASF
jgi:hemolysin activation/secretion protein